MTPEDKAEAKALVEGVRQKPPSYDPETLRTLRLADLLLRAVDEIEQRDRYDALRPAGEIPF